MITSMPRVAIWLTLLGTMTALGCGAVSGPSGAGGAGGSGAGGSAAGGSGAGGSAAGGSGAGGKGAGGSGAGGAVADGGAQDAPTTSADASVDASVADGSIDAPRCVPSPGALQARWRGEMNTDDDTGVFNGTAMGGLAYAPGRHGFAFLFDGANAIVTADPADNLYPPASFSVEAWIQTRTTGNYAFIIEKYDCGGSDACSGAYWGLYLDTSAHAVFEFRVDGGQVVTLTASAQTMNDGSWHHLVGVRDVTARQILLYVDGTLAAEKAITDLGPLGNADGHSDPLTIGGARMAGVDTFIQLFPGAIDEVAYYTRAMTAAEVAAVYAAPDGICH
jgi:hypothetical protein